MHYRKFILSAALILVVVWNMYAESAWQAKRPVALIGSSYGRLEVKILDPLNPLFNGVLTEVVRDRESGEWPEKVHSFYVLRSPMTVVVGDGKKALIGTAKIGRGQITVFGEELFRKRTHKATDAQMYLEIIRNAVRSAGLTTQTALMGIMGAEIIKRYPSLPVL